MGGVPFHVPLLTLSSWPSSANPEIAGAPCSSAQPA